jgi:hypothetical protein
MQAPLLDASVEAPPLERSTSVYDDPAVAGADPLTAAMLRHGLAEEDMAKLRAEGVSSVEFFQSLSDEDLAASGIDMEKRRQEKLARDNVTVIEHHALQLEQQVQSVLDCGGLQSTARQALTAIATIDELRELDPMTMGKLGIGLVDRKNLQQFIATEYVQSVVPVPRPLVLTEPQWEAREQQKVQEQLHQQNLRIHMERIAAVSGRNDGFKAEPNSCMKCFCPVMSTLLHNGMDNPTTTVVDCCAAWWLECLYTRCCWKPMQIPIAPVDPAYTGEFKPNPLKYCYTGKCYGACFACCFPYTMMLHHDE